MSFKTFVHKPVYTDDIIESSIGSDDDRYHDSWSPPSRVLEYQKLLEDLSVLGNVSTFGLQDGEAHVHSISFQPCKAARSQDRMITTALDIHGREWLFVGVLDGHLGEATAEHTANHLPSVVEQFLTKAISSTKGVSIDPAEIGDTLKRAIKSFDESLVNDLLSLFPGGLNGLNKLSNEEISHVINDDGPNLQKTKICMYGTTALVGLVDPSREHLWIANLGDCQGALITTKSDGHAMAEVLTEPHNGSNKAEIERVIREHAGEAQAVINGRILGVIAPFRCIGDTSFKMPPSFTRKIFYNLSPGYHESSPWEDFLSRNQTPPYISNHAEVVYRKLSCVNKQFLVLCSDGLIDISGDGDPSQAADDWAWTLHDALHAGQVDQNLALCIIGETLEANDPQSVSEALESEEPWLDDITLLVVSL